MLGRTVVALVALLAASCSDTETYCCGYSVEYQGGSKVSLIHSGLVLESYTVTGAARTPTATVFEVRPYGASECQYRVATAPDRLSPALPLNRIDEAGPGLAASVQSEAFQPFSSRSCQPKGSSAS
jgi:hypothetical protein